MGEEELRVSTEGILREGLLGSSDLDAVWE